MQERNWLDLGGATGRSTEDQISKLALTILIIETLTLRLEIRCLKDMSVLQWAEEDNRTFHFWIPRRAQAVLHTYMFFINVSICQLSGLLLQLPQCGFCYHHQPKCHKMIKSNSILVVTNLLCACYVAGTVPSSSYVIVHLILTATRSVALQLPYKDNHWPLHCLIIELASLLTHGSIDHWLSCHILNSHCLWPLNLLL